MFRNWIRDGTPRVTTHAQLQQRNHNQDELLLGDYITTRQEDIQSVTIVVGLTSVTLVAVAALLGLMQAFASALNAKSTFSNNTISSCTKQLSDASRTSKLPKLTPALQACDIVLRSAKPHLYWFLWVLIPFIVIGLTGWIALVGLQSVVRRQYLRELEAALSVRSGLHTTTSNLTEPVKWPPVAITFPSSVRSIQHVTHRFHVSKFKSSISDRGSKIAAIIVFVGFALLVGANAAVMIISLATAQNELGLPTSQTFAVHTVWQAHVIVAAYLTYLLAIVIMLAAAFTVGRGGAKLFNRVITGVESSEGSIGRPGEE